MHRSFYLYKSQTTCITQVCLFLRLVLVILLGIIVSSLVRELWTTLKKVRWCHISSCSICRYSLSVIDADLIIILYLLSSSTCALFIFFVLLFHTRTCTCTLLIFILCAYAQLGLHLVALVCVFNLNVWGLAAWKSPVSVIYCSLVELNGQKEAYYARQFVQEKKFGSILLTGWEKSSGKLYYRKLQPFLHAVLANAER